jgi:hypothetical protein
MNVIDVPPVDYGKPLRPLCYALKPPATPGGYSNAHCTIQAGHTCPHIWELVEYWNKAHGDHKGASHA